VVELDGCAEADFDLHEQFIARHGSTLDVAEEAMALEPLLSRPHARRPERAARGDHGRLGAA
jgi:hypothetical protein